MMLLRKYGDEYLAQETSWVGAPDWIDFISGKFPELGYEIVRPEKFDVWGAFIIEADNRDDDCNPFEPTYHLGDDDIEFGNLIGQDLLQKALAKNDIIRAGQKRMLRGRVDEKRKSYRDRT